MQPSTQRGAVVAGILVVAVVAVLVVRARRQSDTERAAAAVDASTVGSDPIRPIPVTTAPRPGEQPPKVAPGGAGGGSAQRVREGVGFDTPGTLAVVPDHYELSPSNGHVMVNFAGGPATAYVPLGREPGAERDLHGMVIDRANLPVVGAVVVISSDMAIMGAHLGGEAGAVTDANGEFTIKGAPVRASIAMAIHSRGWSDLVDAGATPLVLTIRGRGALEGRATYNGHGESFEILVVRAGTPRLMLTYETDADGRYTIASLPPGVLHVSIGLAQQITGGVSKREERDVTIEDGKTARFDVAQVSSTVIVVNPKLPAGYTPQMIEYFLFPGTGIDPATAMARGKAEKLPGMLFGGQDAVATTQFHDVAAGSYTVCAAADRTALVGCTPVTVLDGDVAREIEIKLVASVARD